MRQSLFLLLLAMVVGTVSVQAEERVSKLKFTEACGGSGIADDGMEWTVTSDASESVFDQVAGVHYGTGTQAVRYVQLTSASFNGEVTKVVVNTRDTQADATVSVTVGGTAFTCTGSNKATNSPANYTFTGSGTGEIVVRVERSKSMMKAIYVMSVTCTFLASEEEPITYQASFSVNGVVKSIENYKKGDAVEFPAAIDDVGGLSFMGWTDSPIEGTVSKAPDYVSSFVMGASDVTFYAVFARKTLGGEYESVDNLTYAAVGVSSSTYSDWSGKQFGSGAVFSGNSAGGSQSIQVRSTNPSAIVSTKSAGMVRKIEVEWNSKTTEGRTLDIYGSNKAYSKPANLYNLTSNDVKLGSLVYGTSSELLVEGDYAYIGIRSKSGAQYIKRITITWLSTADVTYSDYCTIVEGMEPDAVPVSIGAAGLATFSSTKPLDFTNVETIAAYTATEEDGLIIFTRIYQVPANTGLLLRNALGENHGAVETENVPLAEPMDAIADNVLVPVAEEIASLPSVDGDYHNYILNNHSQYGLGFFQANGKKVAAGKAYLRTTTAASRMDIMFDGITTDVGGIRTSQLGTRVCYNLHGQRVEHLRKGGLYYQNGKKIFIK